MISSKAVRIALVLAVAMLAIPLPSDAQGWSFDARRIALGGAGDGDNLAGKMIGERRQYGTLVLPFGLIQVLQDFDVLDPTSDQFDLVRTIEYAAGPIHYVIGRGETDSGQTFVSDIRNATLSRDLNRYRGFKLTNQPVAEGLSSPSFGHTFTVNGDSASGRFHGVYVGAGPYLALRTQANIDQKLVDLLASDTNLYFANDRFLTTNASRGQVALAGTVGYRGRFGWAGAGERDGIYVAANFNYLHGFRYENMDLTLRLDTDSDGLLTFSPFNPAPLVISRNTATTGRGMAVDTGIGLVADRWQVGFGVNGIGNRIVWTDVERIDYRLTSLFLGDDEFIESPAAPIGDVRVELPVNYVGDVAYDSDGWSAVAQVGHGFQGASLRGGLEWRLDRLELRGGARYSREQWNPTGGIGLNLSQRVSLDVAAFGTTANAERKRQTAIAVSFRFNHVE